MNNTKFHIVFCMTLSRIKSRIPGHVDSGLEEAACKDRSLSARLYNSGRVWHVKEGTGNAFPETLFVGCRPRMENVRVFVCRAWRTLHSLLRILNADWPGLRRENVRSFPDFRKGETSPCLAHRGAELHGELCDLFLFFQSFETKR